MEIFIKRLFNAFSMLAIVPLLAGCTGGGLAALGLGSLFGLGGGSGASLFGGSQLAFLGETGGSIPVLHNPEPATMVLMGTGIAAMAYFRSRK
jgi:hypothetical protein